MLEDNLIFFRNGITKSWFRSLQQLLIADFKELSDSEYQGKATFFDQEKSEIWS
jgi:hypothetical protein